MMPVVTIRPADAEALGRAQKNLKDATEQRRRMIARAAKNGATLREIAEAVGLSHQRVDQILKESE